MCGLIGAYRLDGGAVDSVRVQQAAHLLRHRGPDGEGYLLLHTASGAHSARRGPDTPANIPHPPLTDPVPFTPDLILAHRRLAILDLSPTGHEPMTVGDGRLWLTFNGEVYNYLELREELKALGCTFQTECDAEVILQAYAVWGTACLDRFIGMFAFALWDQARRRLFCARDRFGIKPFYYAVHDGLFAFASEIKALRPLVPAAVTPDTDQLAWFFHYGRIYNAPHTFFTGVSELPGGHYLLIEDGVVGQAVQWWDINLDRARATYDYHNLDAQFRDLLRDSVRLRLRSDVPVGTCLSGGLDSSTIVALATGLLDGGSMNSFSSVYPVKGLDETRYIDLVADQFHTIAHRITPDPGDFLARADRITWHQDVPSASPTVYSQHFVMKLAHGRVTVLLDGQGADELFAGYLSHAVIYVKDRLRRRPISGLGQAARFAASVYPRFFAAQSPVEFISRAVRAARHGRLPPSPLTADLTARAHARQALLPVRALHSGDPVNDHLYLSVVRDSIPALLHYEDRNSMAYSIEARVPFLDHRLAEFVMGIPSDQKINGAETKVFMRRALRGIVPQAVLDRKDKLGYPTPFAAWLRGPLQAEVGQFLEDTVFRRDWYDPAAARQLWTDHQAGTRNHDAVLYRMIAAEFWLGHANGALPAAPA